MCVCVLCVCTSVWQWLCNVCFRCRIAHSSFSHGGFTLPVIETGVRSSSTTGRINVCMCVCVCVCVCVLEEGHVNLRMGRMAKPDVKEGVRFSCVCVCVCVCVCRGVSQGQIHSPFFLPHS